MGEGKWEEREPPMVADINRGVVYALPHSSSSSSSSSSSARLDYMVIGGRGWGKKGEGGKRRRHELHNIMQRPVQYLPAKQTSSSSDSCSRGRGMLTAVCAFGHSSIHPC